MKCFELDFTKFFNVRTVKISCFSILNKTRKTKCLPVFLWLRNTSHIVLRLQCLIAANFVNLSLISLIVKLNKKEKVHKKQIFGMKNQQFVIRFLEFFLDANNTCLDVKSNNATHAF